ncbi:MAG TPA: hypothetical protein VGF48_22980 [Thermoanaerobaculia bacterium]
MKPYRFFAVVALVLLAAPSLFAADFGIRAGRFDDAETEFLGAEVVIDLGPVNLNPNVEYFLEDDITAGTANLDFTLDVGRFARVQPYLGAGIGLLYVDDDFFGTETDLIGNAIGGVVFNLDVIKPYAQLKYFRVLEEDTEGDDISLAVGVRF